MNAVFIGYDIPLALETKWNHIMPALNLMYKVIEYEGDIVHIINTESEIFFIQGLLESYNTLLQINLTLDVFKIDETLV